MQGLGKIEAFFKAINEGKLEKMSDDRKNQFRIDHGFKHVGPPLPFSESKMIKPPDAKAAEPIATLKAPSICPPPLPVQICTIISSR